MAVVRRITRHTENDQGTAMERNRAEDLRLMQRINAAAAELHRLWSAPWVPGAEEGVGRKARLSPLQAEIDRLYQQRRQLVAERALLSANPRIGRSRRNPESTVFASLAA